MADLGINISTAEVAALATSIRSDNQKMYDDLKAIKKAMDELSNSWQSEAGEAIRSNFNAEAPKFDNYKEIIESYSDFLDKTVARYETDEQSVTNNAIQFK